MDEMTNVVTGEIVMAPADEINYEAQLFMESMHTGLEHAIKCGRLLIEQKASLEHGDWTPWMRENFKFSVDWAEKFMRIAKSDRGLILGANSMKSALRIVLKDKQENHPAPPPAPKETAFSWSTEPKVIGALDGAQAMREGADVLIHDKRDEDVSKYYLTMELKTILQTAVKIMAHLNLGIDLSQEIQDFIKEKL